MNIEQHMNGVLWCAILIIGSHLNDSFAASNRPDGKAVYRQQCAKCHGKAGEGVKKEYEEPLVGDWSMDKLGRYIHKSMPDDKPKSLSPEQAEAVARYIYGEFYSVEARLKKNPPRVELVRLTNRQYLNTVADLLRQFDSPDSPIGIEQGLSASYRGGRRRGGSERTSFDRIDRTVQFDFLAEGADPRVGITNSLNVEWRGAILAEETGAYEFIVKTPNGARLWVNTSDDDVPLIDAGVASGNVDEHRATIHLIGGRAYPLRMEWFKAAKDKLASVSLRWKPPHGETVTIPTRQLAPTRVRSTFVPSTPFPADDSSVGYERGVLISKAWDDATTQSAIEVTSHILQKLGEWSGSRKSDADHITKLQSFCEKFVAAAFRRPLTDGQRRFFVTAHFNRETREQPEDAVKRVVLLALKSPQFLYLGLHNDKLDDFDVASRLSFELWDSLPDPALMQAAARGELHTREQVVVQAKRMLTDARSHAKVRAFLHHWLQVNHAEDLSKDPKLFPGFSPEIIADLRTSLNLFLDEVFWSNTSDYRRLLLEDDLYVNQRLAKFYGIEADASEGFTKVSLDQKERAGVITHPYLLAAFSYQKMSSPIHRGVFLTRNIVGRALRPPPEAVAFKDEEFPPSLTLREKVAALTRSDACQTCHRIINPLGFSLEQYDAVGRFRTLENGRSIDASADYETGEGDKVRFNGARDLAEYAAASDQAQAAFVEQLFHQTVKQPMLAYGIDTPGRLRESFVKSGFNMQQLLVEIATTAALHGTGKPIKPKKT